MDVVNNCLIGGSFKVIFLLKLKKVQILPMASLSSSPEEFLK